MPAHLHSTSASTAFHTSPHPASASHPRIGYLLSYRYMGEARIFCISGCTCLDITISGFHHVATSQTMMARLRVSQAAECRIGVQVLPSTTSGHHKFKVSGAMVSRFVDYGDEREYAAQVMFNAAEPGAAGF